MFLDIQKIIYLIPNIIKEEGFLEGIGGQHRNPAIGTQAQGKEAGREASNGWSDGHQNPHVCFGPHAVRLAYIGNQDIAGFCGHGALLTKELSLTLKNGDAELAFYVV